MGKPRFPGLFVYMEQPDSQSSMLYNTEELMSRKGEYLSGIPDIERKVEEIFQDGWFRRRQMRVTGFQVHSGSGYRGMALGWRDDRGICHIAMPRPLRYELFVLHELAHGLEPHAGHSGDFVATYLELVRRYMGEQAWRELYDLLRLWGVRHRRSPRRPRRGYGPWSDLMAPCLFRPESTHPRW